MYDDIRPGVSLGKKIKSSSMKWKTSNFKIGNKLQTACVFFSVKHNCRTCDQVLAELENIDDECDDYGIQLVKLNDPQLAKRYGIKTFPSLVYFRNGNPLTFDGKNF